jgi:hypothetical protein
MANMNPSSWDEFREQLLEFCVVCRRRHAGSADASGWVIQVLLKTFPVAIKCPECQSLGERAERAVEQSIGPKYHYEGLLIVRDTDDGPQAQAS